MCIKLLTCTEGGADHLDAGSGALRELTGPLAAHRHTVTFSLHQRSLLREFFSPKFERASVPLPEADGAVGAGGGQVAFGAAAERRKLHPNG